MPPIKHLTLGIALAFACAAHAQEVAPQAQQGVAASLSAEILGRYHYRPIPLDDRMSEAIFERYLKQLDGEKLFFAEPDIALLQGVRRRLDDAVGSGDLRLPFLIFNLYARHAIDRYREAQALLREAPDFTLPESMAASRENAPWPKDGAERRELWRQLVKNDWLRLRLAGKADPEIVRTLDRRYELAIGRINRLNAEDAFQSFMSAFTNSIDPHTNYLGPRNADDFEIGMSLSLVGIGAVLEERDAYTTIRELIPGGPAALSGKLKVGDRILAVAQGENGNPVDVFGWRLDETVRLIRGAANSVVELEIIPADSVADAPHRRIRLVRQKISLEDQAAQQRVISLADGRRIGVVSLSTFYRDFSGSQNGAADFSSASRDVAKLLAELRRQRVDAVLVDLRGNGGGALAEAVALTGLFIDRGPVVQQRDGRGQISVESDNDPGMAWDGPLAVLINRESASASEIFAAAIQDYRRGLIIGEASFGKGTVQSVLDLDRYTPEGAPKLGSLTMTVAQFFRINGGTTQLRGVAPDITIPGLGGTERQGENAFPNALPWSRIAALPGLRNASPSPRLTAELTRRQAVRLAGNVEFQFLRDELDRFRRLKAENRISLNEAERRREMNLQEARNSLRKTRLRATGNAAPADDLFAADDGLENGERSLTQELSRRRTQKAAPDVVLREAAQILGDALRLAKHPH